MFAVLKTGGKQYKVQSGDVLRIEKLIADAGETVQFNEVLMLGGDATVIGAPMIADAGVQAEVIDQIKGEKVIHFVKRRRKHSSKRTKGHRQKLTLVRITEILASGADKSGVKAAVGSIAGVALAASEPKISTKSVKAKVEAKLDAAKTKVEAKVEKVKAKIEAAVDEIVEEIKDDLKKLSGVGPALEKKLHDAGVTTYAQISEWTEEHVAEIDEKLSFKGRIQREDWIAQAKKLIKG